MLKSRKALNLSDWEVDELLFYARSGWTPRQLGRLYGVSEKTVQRIIRRCGQEDSDEQGGEGPV